jgi:hypothetical protein
MAKKRTTRIPLSDQLRQAVRECGVSCYRIAQETKIGEATLSRFLSGQRGLTMKAIDTLTAYLGLSLARTDKSQLSKG